MTNKAEINPVSTETKDAQAVPQRGQNQPIFQAPTVVLGVILVLSVIHLGLYLGGENWKVLAFYAFALIPARLGPEPFAQLPGSAYWSLFTYGLLHGSFMHLFVNCLWLLIFSTVVARKIGTLRYLFLFIMTTIAGGLCTLAFHWGERIILVGASAAVSGIMAAAIPIMFAPNMRLGKSFQADLSAVKILQPLELLKNPRAISFAVIWLLMTLLTGAIQTTGVALLGETQIAWEAHLGGFFAGFISLYLSEYTNAVPRPKL